ncbi:hypothetical protein ASG25_21215 [Rhizobium sp. Leaf384]|uniref:hypothetical protein n=1 Tax=unclassified Rhizobium TaxID=2613769 RepID=UPI0007157989|nr:MULTISPECIES: hypothetical protein [unclassified Rhizobium]KQS74319.1 hypothetical protein ASG25_21215 [Rhizobium sp. Leaf384]KQS83963.1 hypothetical protein ASG58_21600 [Rhizobium sp. Leaf383]
MAEQTMKHYGALLGTKAHRRIPADALDRLRNVAISAYWVIAETPYRTIIRYQLGDPEHVVPTLVALSAGG